MAARQQKCLLTGQLYLMHLNTHFAGGGAAHCNELSKGSLAQKRLRTADVDGTKSATV